jgi:hypothetical protein
MERKFLVLLRRSHNYMEKFEQTIPQHENSNEGNLIEISTARESASASFANLELNAENPASPEIRIVVEKQPIDLIEGKSYCNYAVLIDKETEGMRNLAAQAEALLQLPEQERPAKVLEIFRSHMHYAYNDVIEKLSESDPELAKWVAKNTGLSAASVSSVPLSQILEKGYGVCRHLATAYLWLAQKAGLKGVILSSDWGVLKNIERSDTKQKLFRSADVGQPVSAHSWVEIKTSDGRWIPVDPSTKLVGDTEAGLAMFREANYLALGNQSLDVEAEPREKLDSRGTPILFAPAEAVASGIFCLELRSSKPTIRLGKENLLPTNAPYSGAGKLKIDTSAQFGGLALDIVEVLKM